MATLTVEAEVKLEPVSVTATLVPGAPLLGLMLVNVGPMAAACMAMLTLTNKALLAPIALIRSTPV